MTTKSAPPATVRGNCSTMSWGGGFDDLLVHGGDRVARHEGDGDGPEEGRTRPGETPAGKALTADPQREEPGGGGLPSVQDEGGDDDDARAEEGDLCDRRLGLEGASVQGRHVEQDLGAEADDDAEQRLRPAPRPGARASGSPRTVSAGRRWAAGCRRAVGCRRELRHRSSAGGRPARRRAAAEAPGGVAATTAEGRSGPVGAVVEARGAVRAAAARRESAVAGAPPAAPGPGSAAPGSGLGRRDRAGGRRDRVRGRRGCVGRWRRRAAGPAATARSAGACELPHVVVFGHGA